MIFQNPKASANPITVTVHGRVVPEHALAVQIMEGALGFLLGVEAGQPIFRSLGHLGRDVAMGVSVVVAMIVFMVGSHVFSFGLAGVRSEHSANALSKRGLGVREVIEPGPLIHRV